jgi:hypothetical protein
MVCLVDRAGVQTSAAAPRRDLGATDMVGKLASEVNRRRGDCARNHALWSARLLKMAVPIDSTVDQWVALAMTGV